MKKILVLSDSHGNITNMRRAVKLEKPDMIIHLGDHYSDAEELYDMFPSITFEMVKGNCDSCLRPTEKLIEIEGKKIFMCHGHDYHVKSDCLTLQYAALEKEAEIALYGHTHIPFYDRQGALHIMNPGSIGAVRTPYGATYGRLIIENGQIFINLASLG